MAETKNNDTAKEMQLLKDDLKALKTDFQDLLTALKGDSGEKLEDLRDRVESAARSKASTARRRAHDMGVSLRETCDDAGRAMGDHPFTTAAAALCLGLVTGAILGGRRG